MKLLSAQQVKEKKSAADASRIERVRKMNDEETAIVKKLNDTRARADKQMAEIAAGLTTFIEVSEQTKLTLTQEIKTLKAEKKEAMKPVENIKKEAEKLFYEAKKQIFDLEKNRESFDAEREEFSEACEALQDREDDIEEKAAALDQREQTVISQEKKVGESAGALAKKWVEFHKEVHAANADLKKREALVAAGAKTNEAIRLENEAERRRIADYDKAVRDKYAALAQAKIHLGITQ